MEPIKKPVIEDKDVDVDVDGDGDDDVGSGDDVGNADAGDA